MFYIDSGDCGGSRGEIRKSIIFSVSLFIRVNLLENFDKAGVLQINSDHKTWVGTPRQGLCEDSRGKAGFPLLPLIFIHSSIY